LVANEQEALPVVTLVVDANILFSAILSKDGTVAETFREAQGRIRLIAPAYLADELVRLRPRMARSARKSVAEVEAAQRWALAHVRLITEELIASKHWAKAASLTADVDPDDTPYVALALTHRCGLWTGDRKLRVGLERKGFEQVLSTAEVRSRLSIV